MSPGNQNPGSQDPGPGIMNPGVLESMTEARLAVLQLRREVLDLQRVFLLDQLAAVREQLAEDLID